MKKDDGEEQYHGFTLFSEELAKTGDHDRWYFRAFRGESLQFRLIVGITGTAAAMDYSGRVNAGDAVHEIGVRRAHIMIDLRSYDEGSEYEFWVTSYDEEPPKVLDEEIRHSLLTSLYNLYKTVPLDAKYEILDVQGFCEYFQIDRHRYEFNASVLMDKGLIDRSPNRDLGVSGGEIYITANGIELIERSKSLSSTLDRLFSGTREYVDSQLANIAPETLSKLSSVYLDLLEGKSSLKWKQVALACRDIIEDITEELLLPEYLPEGAERPKREQTKNKLRYVLSSKSSRAEISRTEVDFTLALSVHLNEYFTALNDLIQRNVHASEIGKTQAEKCVIYTYLFIGDVLRFLEV